MKRDFIVHTAVEEDVPVQVELKGEKREAKVPGLTVEMIDMENGKAHTHTVFDDLTEAKELFMPGQELTMTIERKHGAPKLTNPKHKDADEYRNPALRDGDKTESQLKDEEKSRAAHKEGKPDPITIPKTSAK
jgi:hypothetical protein